MNINATLETQKGHQMQLFDFSICPFSEKAQKQPVHARMAKTQTPSSVTVPPFEVASFSRKSSFTDVSDTPAPRGRTWGATPRFLGNEVLTSEELKTQRTESGLTQTRQDKKGALTGVFIPTCENMWGVLIFLRFYYIVGQAGIWQTLCAVLLSFAAAFCTTCAMSSIASSGGLVSSGGPYYMISRALGPVIGATIGIMYWLAITMLSVLECLGAVEALAMAAPSMRFPGFRQALGSASMALLALAVWGGMNIVTKLGLLFALVVVFTLFSFYLGLFMTGPGTVAADVPGSEYITGLSWETFQSNWGPHYDTGVHFGTVLSLFYPCFTGILSGANRADVLKDPPRNIRLGTFGAIVFSFFLYSSFFLLWGSVATDPYLKGNFLEDHGRRLSGGDISEEAGRHIVQTVVWNPFPNSAFVGIIITSLSQSLQCLIVAPRLLQNMAKDRLMPALRPLEKLSSSGEPVHALLFTYIAAALLVLIGELELVAPLLSMCFLMAYAFMNCSCFALTWLHSSTWRPSWIHQRRWRLLNLISCGAGFVICITIMIIVHPMWAMAACLIAIGLYLFVNWKVEAKEWGSAMDGITFRLALSALVQLEQSQHQHVNWRPQVLILYRIQKDQQGISSHEGNLRFASQLRKGRGFCMVACVLESQERDEQAQLQAAREKQIIKEIMTNEGIEGFAEVVIAPNMVEGANYIIQLAGIGGLVPNTVLVDWPEETQDDALDFVKILSFANTAEKAVLAVKGLKDVSLEDVKGEKKTIDVWWMIHDGGFLILLSWLLTQHRNWRQSQIRVFTLAENVTEDRAKSAGEVLSRTLRERRLFDVDVEVILADDAMIEPYTYDWTLRVEGRHHFLSSRGQQAAESIPWEIDDLFVVDELTASSMPPQNSTRSISSVASGTAAEPPSGCVVVSDCREEPLDECRRGHVMRKPNSSLPTLGQRLPMPNHDFTNLESCTRLNQVVLSRSSEAELVVLNLPQQWGTDETSARAFMSYCNALTAGLKHVVFVHSSGHEVFDLSN